MATLEKQIIIDALSADGIKSVSADDLEKRFPVVSRATINRRIREMMKDGALVAVGEGAARRYSVSVARAREKNAALSASVLWRRRYSDFLGGRRGRCQPSRCNLKLTRDANVWPTS